MGSLAYKHMIHHGRLLPLPCLYLLSVPQNEGTTQSAVNPGRRVYTVLPPPADYKMHTEESVNPPTLESVNSNKDPAGKKTVIYLSNYRSIDLPS